VSKTAKPLYFRLYVIPPPFRLDWSTPKGLLRRTLINHLIQDKAPIGHLYVDFDLVAPNRFGVNRVLTGMSRANSNQSSMKVIREQVGLGSFFLDFEGKLDDARDAQVENAWALKRNRLRVIKIEITEAQSKHMEQELDRWIQSGAHRHYGGGHQLLRGQGAGCAEFGMHFLSIALQGAATHPDWVREVIAPAVFTGQPKTQNRISMLGLYLNGNAWAKDEAEGFKYRTPDPELLFDWLKRRHPDTAIEIEWKRSNLEWLQQSPVQMPRFEALSGYPVEPEDSVRADWLRIRCHNCMKCR
jgi:hypothetical protein